MLVKINDRKTTARALRKRGNYLFKNKCNELKSVRRQVSCFNTCSTKDTINVFDEDNYVPCFNWISEKVQGRKQDVNEVH